MTETTGLPSNRVHTRSMTKQPQSRKQLQPATTTPRQKVKEVISESINAKNNQTATMTSLGNHLSKSTYISKDSDSKVTEKYKAQLEEEKKQRDTEMASDHEIEASKHDKEVEVYESNES